MEFNACSIERERFVAWPIDGECFMKRIKQMTMMHRPSIPSALTPGGKREIRVPSVEYAADANECNSKTQSNEKLMSIRANLSYAPSSTSPCASPGLSALASRVSATVTVCYTSAFRSNMNASLQFFFWPSRAHIECEKRSICAPCTEQHSRRTLFSARCQRFLLASVRRDTFSLLFSRLLFLPIRLSFAIFYRSVIFYQFVFNTASLFSFSLRRLRPPFPGKRR